MNRPRIGHMISASDRLHRCHLPPDGTARYKGWSKGWRRWADKPGVRLRPRPVHGIYIGYRTYSTGLIVHDWDEGGQYTPVEWYEVWLIVPDDRSKPVPIWPADVV